MWGDIEKTYSYGIFGSAPGALSQLAAITGPGRFGEMVGGCSGGDFGIDGRKAVSLLTYEFTYDLELSHKSVDLAIRT